MPSRVIREGFLDSDKINNISESSQLFFVRLILAADDYGRMDGRTTILRSRCYPTTDKPLSDVSSMLSECCHVNLIVQYEVDNKPYIQILNFNQRLRQKREKYPALQVMPQHVSNMPAECPPESESETDSEIETESEKNTLERNAKENL